MLYEVDWSPTGIYRPGEEFSPDRLFSDCLHNSKEFDLQLGYFSSAAISVLADGFASFISQGGKMRLVINHIVSDKDKEAISRGVFGNIIDCFDLTDFEQLRATFDEYQQQFFDCLAFLIKTERIEIRIIKPKGELGISHTKLGQFYDGDSVTAFSGSANFTISGLFNNLEDVKISRSDSLDPMVRNGIEEQTREFESIMKYKKKGIQYLSPDNLVAAIASAFGDKDIDELIDVEKKLKVIKRKRLLEKEERQSLVNEDDELPPRFPFASGPRDYQKLAFENWLKNGQKGLFAMATGTGKTITSLNVLLEIYKRKGYYKALVLVPTITLVNQWEEECRKFRFHHIIKVCSKNKEWREKIERLTSRIKYHDDDDDAVNYIIIATYASYARKSIFNALNDFEESQLLLIADEAHNMGSPGILKQLRNIPYFRKIGLSATPKRQFDEEANQKLFAFFGAEEEYTYEYSMEEAIRNGVLCRYFYYPHIVELTDAEMYDYVELSQKISKYFNYNTGTFDKKDDILMALLLARKRIIHKAANKLEMFKKIIHERYAEKGDLKYTLVYAPEGLQPDYLQTHEFESQEEIPDDNDSERLINQFTEAVMKVGPFVTVKKFVSGEKDREQTLADFASGKLQVLTSMKCLDEGVDVPRSELAIFCSSTGNPRQFIQRRGRVLRTHKDKRVAILHDLVVAPAVSASCSSFAMERSLLKTELMRVKNFAMLSENSAYSLRELHDIMQHYGLNLFNNDHIC